MLVSKSETSNEVHFRSPTKLDGAGLFNLVRAVGVLDVNSAYAYMLIGEHHGGTSVVAEIDGELVGFISAYIPPVKPDTLFVWQVGVAEAGRGRGLATRMLREILEREACADVCYVDTTISPSNTASKALFRGLARRLGSEVVESELFAGELFGDCGDDLPHEPEILFRIGPFDSATPGRFSA